MADTFVGLATSGTEFFSRIVPKSNGCLVKSSLDSEIGVDPWKLARFLLFGKLLFDGAGSSDYKVKYDV